MKFNRDPRHQARRLLLNYIYSLEVSNKLSVDVDYIVNALKIDSYDQKLFNKIILEYPNFNIKIIEQISPLISTWNVDQLLDLDIIAIKIAILESIYLKLTPTKVAVDEAIELSKEFGGEKSSKFVNGVLAKVINNN